MIDYRKMYMTAYGIAYTAHAYQKRKDGSPYFEHVKRVSEAFPIYSVESIVGLLHDLLEDCPGWDMQRLVESGISHEVVQLVDILTHKSYVSYLDYIHIIKEDKQATSIKLADIADNLVGSTGTLRDKYLMAKYILEN